MSISDHDVHALFRLTIQHPRYDFRIVDGRWLARPRERDTVLLQAETAEDLEDLVRADSLSRQEEIEP